MKNEQQGVNILTSARSVMVDGATELINSFFKKEINAEEFYQKILDLDTVYIDRSQVKEFKEGDKE